MMKSPGLALPLALPLALAALALGGCSKKPEDQPKAAAGGELLPRSVSDDMLPYDTVKSQASLSNPEAGLRPVRAEAPEASASIAPVEDAATPQEDATVIDPAPAPSPSTQP